MVVWRRRYLCTIVYFNEVIVLTWNASIKKEGLDKIITSAFAKAGLIEVKTTDTKTILVKEILIKRNAALAAGFITDQTDDAIAKRAKLGDKSDIIVTFFKQESEQEANGISPADQSYHVVFSAVAQTSERLT